MTVPTLQPIHFEQLLAALELTTGRGTGESAPTHRLKMGGTLQAMDAKDYASHFIGLTAEFDQYIVGRQWGEYNAKGPANVNNMPLLMRQFASGGVSAPTNPGASTNTDLWTFLPSMTSDNLNSATIWYGNPNLQYFRGVFGMMDEFSLTSDGNSTKSIEAAIKGHTQFPSEVSTPTLPSLGTSIDPLLSAGRTQLWVDTSSGIGSTEVVGIVSKTGVKLSRQIQYHFDNVGPTGDLTYTGVSISPVHLEITATVKLIDLALYHIWSQQKAAKLRLRYNGDKIETASAVDYFNFINFDAYGPFRAIPWGDINRTRTVEIAMQTVYDVTAGRDWSCSVQKLKTGTL